MNGPDTGRTTNFKSAAAITLLLFALSFLAGCGAFDKEISDAETIVQEQMESREWFYEQFDKIHRNAYDAFREAAKDPFGEELTPIRDSEGGIVEIPVSELDSVYQGFMYDHPELFWLDRSYRFRVSDTDKETLADAVAIIPLAGSGKELAEYEERFSDAVSELLQSVSEDAAEGDYPGIFYDLLAEQTEYTEEALYDPAYLNEHTAYGAIVEKSAVCDGFALAYKYLLGCRGIDCIVIPGEIDGAAHVWNIAFWNDTWHEMDITWDASSESGSRDYFDLTTEEMNRDHTREAEGIGLLIPVSGE